jgi:glutaminase
MDFNDILAEIAEETKELEGKGKVANYIPALAQVSGNQFGMALLAADGELFEWGDSQTNFSMQSISKVLTLTIAFREIGSDVWERVGREPSGNPFNSLIQLEKERGIPRNPFINAGALVISDILCSRFPNPKEVLLDFVQKRAQNTNIQYDKIVAQSEKEHGYLNSALVNYMKSFGNITNNPEEVLDLYFNQCSLSMNCVDLVKTFSFITHRGFDSNNKERILSRSRSKRLNALMLTCGMYDESGDFAFRVGMPGKSGVGGGIAATIPGKLTMAVWSPELNNFGNSLRGIKAMELFTTKTGMSIF